MNKCKKKEDEDELNKTKMQLIQNIKKKIVTIRIEIDVS